MNKYEKWYASITENAKNRFLSGYTERHHVIPESLGGTNGKDNLVDLTAQEHFVCHWLLTKIYPIGEEHWKMLNALRMMRAENPKQQRYDTKITGRVYAKLKEEYSILQSIRYSGNGNGMYGKSHTKEAKQKISKANTGENNGAKQESARQKIAESKIGKKRRQFTDEWIKNLSLAKQGSNNNMYGKSHKESSLQLMREKATGRKQSEETIKKKADAIRGSKREKKLCVHCNQHIAVNGYARFHGTRCRFLLQP